MAKRVWVYALTDGVADLQDFQGNDDNNVQCGKVYTALDNHPEMSTDGSKKLYHAQDGIIEMSELNAIVKAHPCGAVVPPPPNDTTFVSAETFNGWGVHVNLSDDKGYESDNADWELKVGGVVIPNLHVSGYDTNQFILNFTNAEHPTAPMAAGDVITVSKLTASHGIKQFLDQPVTNNLT